MTRSRRRTQSIWIGRLAAVLMLGGLTAYFLQVGWDAADKVGSSVGLIVAIAALVAPYLFPATKSGGEAVAKPFDLARTGKAEARDGGVANTGLEAEAGDRPIKVSDSGDAFAQGPGSVANTGARQVPRKPE